MTLGSHNPEMRKTGIEADEGQVGEDVEAKLLDGLRRRQRDALERIALRYSAKMSRAAYLFLGDEHGAADVMQDALISAWDGAERTSESTKLRPWLFGILFNLCRLYLRANARRSRRHERAAEMRAASGGGDTQAGRLEILRDALKEIEPAMREIIVLRYDLGMSVSEVAQALAIPEGTVKSRTHSAIEWLRERMKE